MSQNNSKFGYFCSIALHACIALAAFVSALWALIFPTEKIEDPVVFEMIAPPAPEQPQTQQPEPEPMPPEPNTPEIKEIEPLELPEPEPEPEPTPPEPQPEPKPEPKPVEKPKKIKPKPQVKPEPKPKTVNIKDWKKTHKKRTSSKPSKRQAKPIDVPKITMGASNLSSIANVSVRATNSAAMKNILAGYIQEIYIQARGNWAVPTSATSLAATVEFNISRRGIISGLRIKESSGDKEFDNSVLSAFQSISLRPPPDNEPHLVTIRFTAN